LKLKDYEIPADGSEHGFDQSDLKQYDLKNFDLAQLQSDLSVASAAQELVAPMNVYAPASPDPLPTPYEPTPDGWLLSPPVASAAAVDPTPPSAPHPSFPREASPREASPKEASPAALVATQEPPSSPPLARSPLEEELQPFAVSPCDVLVGSDLYVPGPDLYVPGPDLALPGLGYNPFSPSPQAWSLPRWFLVTVGIFCASCTAVAITFCVVLLRGPNAAPAAQAPQASGPTAPVVATSAPVAQPTSGSPADKAPGEVARAVPEVRPTAPTAATSNRIVLSRQSKFVRRQTVRSHRIADRGSDATDTASSRPPQDALDKLLAGSTL
jgi:hypothetical protein